MHFFDSTGQLPIWQFVARVVILYGLVMIALRIMGKREIGKLSVFDFVVSVMIAELSTLPMENTDVPLARSLLTITLLVALQFGVAVVSLKSHRFRHWVEGEPSVLIEHGQIKDNAMRKTRYSMHDLLMQLREKGYADVANVEFAILETSGHLSVIPSAEHRPLTPQDMSIHVEPQSIPKPVIVDGVPVQKTLKEISRDENWLTDQIATRGYGTIPDVMYATVDSSGNLQIDAMDPKAQSTPDDA